MQFGFLVGFALTLVCFSFAVGGGVEALPYVVTGTRVPGSVLVRAALWSAAAALCFAATGLFLYERERDEGRIYRRIALYDWILDRRTPLHANSEPARPIRTAGEGSDVDSAPPDA